MGKWATTNGRAILEAELKRRAAEPKSKLTPGTKTRAAQIGGASA